MNKYTPHEVLKLHELLSYKVNSLNKIKAYYNLVSDSQLKNIIEQVISNATSDIVEINLLEEQTF